MDRPRFSFYDWLVTTQIGPAFAKHGFLRSARVLVIPPSVGWDGRAIELLIFYSTQNGLDYDGAEHALVTGSDDPNLPPGMTNHQLYEPVVWGNAPGAAAAPPIAFCAAESFHVVTRSEEYGYYEDFDAFAGFGTFVRAEDGVKCLSFPHLFAKDLDNRVRKGPTPD